MKLTMDKTIERLFAEIAKLFVGYEVYAVGGLPRDLIMGREYLTLILLLLLHLKKLSKFWRADVANESLMLEKDLEH